jgi:hypothetical protein
LSDEGLFFKIENELVNLAKTFSTFDSFSSYQKSAQNDKGLILQIGTLFRNRILQSWEQKFEADKQNFSRGNEYSFDDSQCPVFFNKLDNKNISEEFHTIENFAFRVPYPGGSAGI